MRDRSTITFTQETYAQDLFEFTGKSINYWIQEKEKWDKFEIKNNTSSPSESASIGALRGNGSWKKITHKQYIKVYNHPAQLANAYASKVHRDIPFDFEDKPIARFTQGLLQGKKKYALDHGSGAKINPLWLQGYHLTLADLPTEWFKFFAWRIKKYKVIDIDTIFVTPERQFSYLEERKFDFIWSHDSLEHCISAHKVLAHLSEHLKKDGFFFISLVFDDGGSDLDRNCELFSNSNRGNKLWRDCIGNAGLEKYCELEGKEIFIKKKEVNWNEFNFQ